MFTQALMCALGLAICCKCHQCQTCHSQSYLLCPQFQICHSQLCLHSLASLPFLLLSLSSLCLRYQAFPPQSPQFLLPFPPFHSSPHHLGTRLEFSST
ncbi:hypothetical protein Tsubulata_024716 [Turnera subulata]|uniref:Secreted protein n=1 Tax=Turnera subulata TaxID=218843 RepID=A0A9Q0GLE6_9ROSI|nr:hypothetical protein Tsubulata_024716 [Turnera subulata]